MARILSKVGSKYSVVWDEQAFNPMSVDEACSILEELNVPTDEVDVALTSLIVNSHTRAIFDSNNKFLYTVHE